MTQALAALAAPESAGQPGSAVLTLAGGTLWPFAFVLPALSKSASHAVYFSDRHDATGPVQLDFATVTFGERDRQPALHCHAQWREANGARPMARGRWREADGARPMAACGWAMCCQKTPG